MSKSMQIALEKQHSTGINKQFPHLKVKTLQLQISDVSLLQIILQVLYNINGRTEKP